MISGTNALFSGWTAFLCNFINSSSTTHSCLEHVLVEKNCKWNGNRHWIHAVGQFYFNEKWIYSIMMTSFYEFIVWSLLLKHSRLLWIFWSSPLEILDHISNAFHNLAIRQWHSSKETWNFLIYFFHRSQSCWKSPFGFISCDFCEIT